MEENKEKTMNQKAKEQVEEEICLILENNSVRNDVDYLYKLVDIHKDLCNEDYWQERKDEIRMRYNDYGNYNEGYGRRYSEGYGRRGVPGTGRGRYRGEEMLDEMKYHYGNYQDSYNAGNYSAKEDSSYKMTEAFKEFVFAVGEELEPKDKQMFKQAMYEMVQKLN